jgi:hypothetical protein
MFDRNAEIASSTIKRSTSISIWLSPEEVAWLDKVRVGMGPGTPRSWAVFTRSALLRYLLINEATERGVREGAVMRMNGTLVEYTENGRRTTTPSALVPLPPQRVDNVEVDGWGRPLRPAEPVAPVRKNPLDSWDGTGEKPGDPSA